MPNRKGLLAYRLGLEAYHRKDNGTAAKRFWAAYQAGIVQGGVYHLKIQLEKHMKEPLSFEDCQTLFHAQRKQMENPFQVDGEWLHQRNEKASLFRHKRSPSTTKEKKRGTG